MTAIPEVHTTADKWKVASVREAPHFLITREHLDEPIRHHGSYEIRGGALILFDVRGVMVVAWAPGQWISIEREL